MVDVSNLKDAVYDTDMIDNLVMADKRIKLLRALAQGFMRTDAANQGGHWTADFVKGKGNSQIFLLHGPPGVGKTFTAGELVPNERFATLTSPRMHR